MALLLSNFVEAEESSGVIWVEHAEVSVVYFFRTMPRLVIASRPAGDFRTNGSHSINESTNRRSYEMERRTLPRL